MFISGGLYMKLEAAETVKQMQPFVGREFTEKESTLAMLSFLVWYAQAEELRRANHPYFEQYVGAPNVSARGAGIEFMTDGLATPGVVEAVKEHFPRFDPKMEAPLAETPTHAGDAGYDAWQDSLTRVMIITTRALAYSFCNGGLENTRTALANGLEPTLDMAEELVAEWLTPAPARLLRKRTMATVKSL